MMAVRPGPGPWLHEGRCKHSPGCIRKGHDHVLVEVIAVQCMHWMYSRTEQMQGQDTLGELSRQHDQILPSLRQAGSFRALWLISVVQDRSSMAEGLLCTNSLGPGSWLHEALCNHSPGCIMMGHNTLSVMLYPNRCRAMPHLAIYRASKPIQFAPSPH